MDLSSELDTWRKAVAEEGAAQGLMPALLEFFDDFVADGLSPEAALEHAKRACEIVDLEAEV